jgi:hypothetical protein
MHTCPVCGFTGLEEPPRSPTTGGGSYEICASCGFEFGVTDDDQGYSYEAWRARWIANGMRWSSVGQSPPEDWNPGDALRKLLGDEGDR